MAWRKASIASLHVLTGGLRVDGLVEVPLELTYAEVRAIPEQELLGDIHCVTGWSHLRMDSPS